MEDQKKRVLDLFREALGGTPASGVTINIENLQVTVVTAVPQKKKLDQHHPRLVRSEHPNVRPLRED